MVSDGNSDVDEGEATPRRARRDSLLLQATIVKSGGAGPVSLRVRNLSEGGLMADLVSGFAMEEAVSIDLRGVGIVAGRVAWATQRRIGVTFDSVIDPQAARLPVGGKGRDETLFHVPGNLVRRPGLRTG